MWRFFAAVYNAAWLLCGIVVFSNEMGVKWLIYFTNLSYALLVLTFTMLAITSLVYTIFYYCKRSSLQSYLPELSEGYPDVYDQDNIVPIIKVIWFLYISAISLAFLTPWSYHASFDEGIGHNAITFHFNGINMIFVLADLLLSRMPLQLFHCPWCLLAPSAYMVFTAMYYAMDQKDPYGNAYIYPALDYGNNSGTSTGYAVLIIITPSLVYVCLWFIVRVRDAIQNCCGRCGHDLLDGPITSEDALELQNLDVH